MNKDQREIHRKLRILQYADKIGHVAKACRYFGIGRSSFYRWREASKKHGEVGLINAQPIPKRVLSDKLEHASIGTPTSTSSCTEIKPLHESGCTFLLEGLSGF